jgi:hypothetical protein
MTLAILPNAAAELASWTWSPRLRHNFKRPLDFVCVPPVVARRAPIVEQENLKTVLCERSGLFTAEIWQLRNDPSYVEGIRKFDRSYKKLINPSSSSETDAKSAPSSDIPDDALREPRDNDAYRHAELAVLLYATAMQKHAPGLRACSYIGISKLTCLCCAKFIEVYNQQHGTAWVTGGSHGKFYQWSFLSQPQQQPPQPQRSSKAELVAFNSAGSFSSPLDTSNAHDEFGSILARTLTLVTNEFAAWCKAAYAPWRRTSDAASDSGGETGTNTAGRDYQRHGSWTTLDDADEGDEGDQSDKDGEEDDK